MVDLAAMVSATLAADRKQFNTVLMMASNARKVRLVADVLPKDLPLTVLTSQNRVIENLNESGIECTLLEESLTAQGLNVLNQMHDLVLQAIGEGRLSRGERLLVVLAEPIDGVMVVDTTMLNTNRFANLAQEFNIDLEVLTQLMKLARHLGGRGREGHAIGALFAIGALPSLRKHSTALVLNPFKGHPVARRDILREDTHETILEFAWLDGAILFNRAGVASDAGRYIQVTTDVPLHSGEGGRHLAAKALSIQAAALAICVSSGGRISVYWRGRTRYSIQVS